MKQPLALITALVCLLWSWPTSASGAQVARDDLERYEDHVEDFANSLHDFSFTIVSRNSADFESFLGEGFTGASAPVATEATLPVQEWIFERTFRPFESGVSRESFLDAWGDYFASWQSIEDVRIKIKKANLDFAGPVRGDADIKFFWLGRNDAGLREWVKGKGRLKATKLEEGKWRIDQFQVKDFHAKVSRVDLFAEVSGPAGVANTVPRWGEPGNEVFLSHGVAVADVNNDGLQDVFVTGNHENYLYLNQGDGTFLDDALSALVGVTPLATGAVFLDFDNDGDSDLFLAAAGSQMLFENRVIPDGILLFEEVTESAGVGHAAEGYSALAADVNGDGLQDIYVCSYNKYGQIMPNSWSDATNGTPNLLFVNQGNGSFREAAAEWNCGDSRWTYAGQFADANGDGRPDLYLANDFGKNAFLINEGGRFRDAADEVGLVDTGNGMGVSFGDFNNDGQLDVHVTNMSSTAGNRILKSVFPNMEDTPEYARVLEKIAAGNTLFRNVDGQFEDVTKAMGPFSAGWSFGGGFVDFDNDGWEDLHSPNGFISGKGLKDT